MDLTRTKFDQLGHNLSWHKQLRVDYNPKLQDDEVSDYHCATNSLRLKLLALNLHWLVAFPSLDDSLAAVLGSIDPVE